MKADKIILGAGKNVTYTTDCNETGLNNNIIVSGGSGSGKTVSVTEMRLLNTYSTNLVVTVTKRRIVNKYKKLFEERGYVVEDLNFTYPTKSKIAFDPLQYIKSYTDITFLAESIVKADPKKDKSNSDPYWDEAAISLLSAEISYVLMTNEKATLADVLDFHDSLNIRERGDGITSSADAKFTGLEIKDPGCFAVTCWKSFKNLPMRTASCIFSTLNTTLDTLFSPELRKMIRLENKVDFKEIASKKTVLFVSTSAVNPSLNCFVNMFYGQMFKELFEFAEKRPNGKLPIPMHVICDDFATGSKILNFPEYISIFREKDLSVTILIQSESQLESIYGADDAVTIINNADTYLFLGGMDLTTARHISERLDKPLCDVLYMPIGQEIIFRRGQKPIITKRYDIYQDELFQELTAKYEHNNAR